ncbi:hypothetical protein [Polyangium mundeleinium]|uniref:Uncharacterized protein n=1 Tax=Polyangium mundeleinium TaxID=2995306 RepID=A0ABT5EQZ1_9BACT|nr:hypothetical protein [Polyangium mundeleinium]MDC0743126.1 hypothetical protein [Polyangium mundeleinium]
MTALDRVSAPALHGARVRHDGARGHRGGATLDVGLVLASLVLAGRRPQLAGLGLDVCLVLIGFVRDAGLVLDAGLVHRGGRRGERRNLPRGLAAVTALDRVNSRARRGGGCVATDPALDAGLVLDEGAGLFAHAVEGANSGN